jgi:hypothetical protein
MNVRVKLFSAVLAPVFLLVARPATAALFDAFHPLDLQVKLTQPALADGNVRLAPGTYDVHVTTSADGAVLAGFFQGGAKRGEARGIIAVRKAGGEKTHTFQSLGFHSASPSALRQAGQKLTLEIGAPGANQVFIWFAPPPAAKQ